MRPTRWSVLVAAAVVAAVVTFVALEFWWARIPPMPATAPLSFGFLAIALFGIAVSARPRLQRRPGSRPMNPLVAAWLLALAKACAVAGAIGAGFYGGLLLYVLPELQRLPTAQDDAVVAGIGVGVCLLLVGASLLLEAACRVDGPDEPPGDPGTDPDFLDIH